MRDKPHGETSTVITMKYMDRMRVYIILPGAYIVRKYVFE